MNAGRNSCETGFNWSLWTAGGVGAWITSGAALFHGGCSVDQKALTESPKIELFLVTQVTHRDLFVTRVFVTSVFKSGRHADARLRNIFHNMREVLAFKRELPLLT